MSEALKPEPITRFDRKAVSLVSDLLLSAAQAIAHQYGLTVQRERGSFRHDHYTCTFTFRSTAPPTPPKSWPEKAARIGVPESWWGRCFWYEGKKYCIQDIKTRNWKYPLLVEQVATRKIYKFPIKLVTRLLAEDPA